MTTDVTNPKPRRRWFQFSLRTLMLFMLLVSLGVGWVAARMRTVKRQEEVVAAIKALGGSVRYDYQPDDPFGGHLGIIADPSVPGPLWLRNLLGNEFFTNVNYVDLRNAQVTDAGLARLKELTHLEGLDLTFSTVTNDGLAQIKGMNTLDALWLSYTQVGDAGLEYIKVMPQLRYLELYGTNVTKVGLANLQKALPKCQLYSKLPDGPMTD